MTNEQKCMVEKIDVEALISMKYQLKQKKLLEPILSTNLDYAVAVITSMPSPSLVGATLCITGESMLVKFLADEDGSGLNDSQSPAQPYQSNIHLTVVSDNGQPKLIGHVTCGDVITVSDIKDFHFPGHNCQDMVQSCSKQARILMLAPTKVAVLHIICNRLSLTYSIGKHTKDDQSVNQSPQTTQHNVSETCRIKTQCRLKFSGFTEIGRLLKMKCWIEREKPQKKGLIDCVDHLLKQFTELPNPPCNCAFILQSDGEMVELVSDSMMGPQRYFHIFGGPNGVSMVPDKWQKD